MRAAERTGRTVVLRLRFGDFSRATRSHTLPRPTAQTMLILDTARTLLASAQPEIAQRGLTLVGISIANLEDDEAVQLTLPFVESSADAIDAAVDAVRDRFGSTAITRGVLLGREGGFEMPHLPDKTASSVRHDPASPRSVSPAALASEASGGVVDHYQLVGAADEQPLACCRDVRLEPRLSGRPVLGKAREDLAHAAELRGAFHVDADRDDHFVLLSDSTPEESTAIDERSATVSRPPARARPTRVPEIACGLCPQRPLRREQQD
jgi:hypothetical protein